MLWDSLQKVYTQSSYEFMKCYDFLCEYAILRYALDLRPVDLESLRYICCHVVIVCSTSDRNRTTPGCVIDNLANFVLDYVTL